MKKILLLVLLMASPAWAQTQLVPKGATAKGGTRTVDNCAPIGRTANGELVYSMKCDNLPAPPPPPPQAEVRETPAPEPAVRSTGIFGMSRDLRKDSE